jgi:hypothetical protein
MDLSYPRYIFCDVFTHNSSNSDIATQNGSSHSFLIKLSDDPYIIDFTQSLVDFQQVELNGNMDVTHMEIRLEGPNRESLDFNGVNHQLFLEFE